MDSRDSRSLKVLSLNLKVKDSLEFILFVSGAMAHLEDQVRALPKAYKISGTSAEGLIGLSKAGIRALKEERYEDAARIEEEINYKWEILSGLYLPDGWKERFIAQAGQEIVEYYGVKAGLRVLFDGAEEFIIPLPKDLKVNIQTFLPGLGDVPGELYKILRHRMTMYRFSKEEKYYLWQRLHAICQQIYEVLEGYADVPPAILHAGHHRRYSFKFCIIPRVRDILERCEEQMLRWKERIEEN